jgi:hypothetical protein
MIQAQPVKSLINYAFYPIERGNGFLQSRDIATGNIVFSNTNAEATQWC